MGGNGREGGGEGKGKVASGMRHEEPVSKYDEKGVLCNMYRLSQETCFFWLDNIPMLA